MRSSQEEGGLPEVEFLAIYGAMTINGVPKPVWRAFQLLHEHAGDRRLPTVVSQPVVPNTTTAPFISAFATVNASDGIDSLRVFLSFWGNPDSATNATLMADNRDVTVTVHHPVAAEEQTFSTADLAEPGRRANHKGQRNQATSNLDAIVYIVDAVHGNPFAKWEALGKL